MHRRFVVLIPTLSVYFGCQAEPLGKAPSAEPAERGVSVGEDTAGAEQVDPEEEDTGREEPVHIVEVVADGGGSLSPTGEVRVSAGERLTVELSPAEGHAVGSVGGTCGGSLEDLRFTTAPVAEDCTVGVVFEEELAEPAAYCSGIPAEEAEVVVCDPELNLDDWSAGRAYWTTELRIPSGKVLAMPFTANAEGRWGIVELTNNMPGLSASGLLWHGWFSELPGGPRVEESAYCQGYSPNPNPTQLKWTQAEPTDFECPLGTAERTLYFNMEVRCFEELSDDCTPGERYPEDYWLGVRATPVE